jgi:hypothetical protein
MSSAFCRISGSFLQVLAILIATLAHHVPEQNAALCGVDHVFDGGAEHIERQDL